MTNFSELTDQELNELIAKQRGYTYSEHWKVWFGKQPEILSTLPDYVNSWQWSGELLIEILMADPQNEASYWQGSDGRREFIVAGFASERLTRAIAEAYAMENCHE